jgi:hypothetical protein
LAALPALAEPPAPVIRIRAHARLTLGTVEKIPNGVAVDGTLWDDAAGGPVAGKRVRVGLRDPQSGALLEGESQSDDGGAFRVELPAPLGSYQVQADFDGDGDYPEPRTIARTVDVTRRPVELVLSAPDRAGVGSGGLPVAVVALVDGRPADLQVKLAIDLRPAVIVETGETGRAEAMLDLPSDVGPSAHLVVRARFAGDEVHDAAISERAVLITTPTTVTASLDEPTIHRGDEATVSGRLDDARGSLAVQVVLAVAADGRTLGQATTDTTGHFTIPIATRQLTVGNARFAVHYDPPVSYRDGSRSPSLELTVLPAMPVPLGGYLFPPLFTLLAIGAVWAWRRSPWRLFSRQRVTPADEQFPVEERQASGLVEARRPMAATFRRAHDLGASGVVWDAPFDRPVAAQVRVVGGGASQTVACDARGRFTVENLPPGKCLFTIFAPGYLPVRFERELPHRGELRGVRVNLQPLRAEILAIYKQVTLGFLPELRFAALWTPRELCDHVRKSGALPPSLSALSDLLEEAYYSPRIPGEDALAEAMRLAAHLDAPLRGTPLDRGLPVSL